MHSVQSHRLSNGLRLLTIHRPGLHHAHALIRFPVGSRDESAAGLAHYFEHCALRGSTSLPASAWQSAMDALDADTNATTSPEETTFHVTALPRRLSRAVALIGEALIRPVFDGHRAERAAVLAEQREDYGGVGVDPFDTAHAQVFRRHPLTRPVLGTRASVNRLGPAALYRHHAAHIRAPGALAVAVGPQSHTSLLAALAGAFSGLSATPPALRRAAPEPPRKPSLCLVHRRWKSTNVTVTFPSFAPDDPDVPAASALCDILGTGSTSLLYRRLREDMGLVYGVHVDHTMYSDAGLFSVNTQTDARRAAEAVEAILDVLTSPRVLRSWPLRRARSVVLHRLASVEDDVANLAEFYAWGAMYRADRTLADARRDARSVTHEDIARVAARLFDVRRVAVTVLGKGAPRFASRLRRLVGTSSNG